MNNVTLLGNIGNNPEVRDFENGSICTVSLATNKKWKDKMGYIQEKTQWHNLLFSGKLVDLAKDFHVGQKIAIQGEIEYRDYEKNGENRKYTQIRVSKFWYCTAKEQV